jgi:hypothetical protein
MFEQTLFEIVSAALFAIDRSIEGSVPISRWVSTDLIGD